MRVRKTFQVILLAVATVLAPISAAADSGFQIGPIPGLTTAWHPAPKAASIPLEGVAKLEFRRKLPSADSTVAWSGANEVSRDGQWSIAECPLAGAGSYVVTATTVFPNGSELEHRVVLDAVAIAPESIEVSPIRVAVDPIELDETDLNASTFEYYRGLSIADLRQVSDNWYRTSTRRPMRLSVDVDPPGFAPLMEWRSPGKTPRLGSPHTVTHVRPHIQQVSVGPTAAQRAAFFETYSVRISSHVSNHDVVPEEVPVTFTAVTDPPGHEEEVTWLASTKYGGCDPVMGRGPEFTVRFEDTWGPHPSFDQPFQWLGVKADHAIFNQDAKCLGPDLVPVPGAGEATPPFSFCRVGPEGLEVTVRNRGSEPSGPADLFVLRQGDPGDDALSFGIIPGLESKEQVTFTVPLADCCDDMDAVQIFVDSNFEVGECNEDNNIGFSACAFGTLTSRVVDFMVESTDGNVGVLLREIGGPTRASFNADTVFEPASTIKTVIHLHGMLEVQDGSVSLGEDVFWLADVGRTSCGGNDCYNNNTVPETDPRDEAHRLMMQCSDNALTQALRDDYSDAAIDATLVALGLSDTALNHSIGCAGEAAANHNQLTLADLASLHEQVATGLLDPEIRATFYDLMPDGTGFVNGVIDDEAASFGLSAADVADLKAGVETAWKNGSYGLSDGRYRSLAGWLKVPFACEGNSREYFFGASIDQASDLDLQNTGQDLSIFAVAAELLRDELRAAVVSSQCH